MCIEQTVCGERVHCCSGTAFRWDSLPRIRLTRGTLVEPEIEIKPRYRVGEPPRKVKPYGFRTEKPKPTKNEGRQDSSEYRTSFYKVWIKRTKHPRLHTAFVAAESAAACGVATGSRWYTCLPYSGSGTALSLQPSSPCPSHSAGTSATRRYRTLPTAAAAAPAAGAAVGPAVGPAVGAAAGAAAGAASGVASGAAVGAAAGAAGGAVASVAAASVAASASASASASAGPSVRRTTTSTVRPLQALTSGATWLGLGVGAGVGFKGRG